MPPLEKSIYKRLRFSLALVYGSCPILATILLAPFSVLAGFMTGPELIKLLKTPLSIIMILIGFGLSVMSGLLPMVLFHRKRKVREPSWQQIKRFNYSMPALYVIPLIITNLNGAFLLTKVIHVEYPGAGLTTMLFITAFFLMLCVPLLGLVNTQLDQYNREISQEIDTIFNISFKISLVIISVFIGTITLLILIASVSSIAVFTLGRELPLGVPVLFLIGGTVSLMSMVLGLAMILKNIVLPLRAMTQAFDKGAGGDLTVEITSRTSDETGLVDLMANKLFTNLNQGFTRIIGTMKGLSDNKEELGNRVEEMASSVVQIRENLKQTNYQMEEHSASVVETTASVEQLARNIDALGNSIEQQKGILTDSSKALDKLVDSNNKLTTLARENKERTDSLVTVSKEGSRRIQGMQDMMSHITNDSQLLAEANTLIASVASQTNLLAMNAAIEAAHAGDAGRGFAVVSEEIRKLAETASEQSKSIGTNLKLVLKRIEQVGEESRSVQSTFSQIDSHVGGVKVAVENMNDFTDTVMTYSAELQKSVGELETVSESVIQGSQEMKIGNSEILKAITTIRDISQRVQEAVEEISQGAEEIANQSSLMLEQNKSTDDSLDEVNAVVSTYRIHQD